MEASGMRVMAVVAISGCSLLFMALNRRRFVGASRIVPRHREEGEEAEPTADVVYSLKSLSCETPHSAGAFRVQNHHLSGNASSLGKKKTKKVRFSEDVEEPSSNNAEYRRRHATGVAAVKRRREKSNRTEALGVAGELRDNRRALYNGLAQFRSQRRFSTGEEEGTRVGPIMSL